ncbi:MAG: TolC family protein [Cyclobacteriaceae bacterium]|nr:TolC family protein [Cyclobacteriaceae bacterium]
MNRFFGVAAIVFLMTTLSLQGQTASKVLTFEEAVKIAMKNSVLLNQQRNNLELSQMQKASAIASAGPNVSLNATASQFSGNSFNQQVGQVVNGVRDNISGSLNANMNLFSGFNRVNSIRQFSNQLEAQKHFVNRTAQDIINTVSNQYLQVMLDVELLRIAKENFEALNKQYEQTREQVALGSRSPVDEYNQDALAKAAELRMVQAEIILNNDKALLTQTLLMDAFEQFDVEKPNWDINALGNEVLDPEKLANDAKQHREDYLRALRSEEAQRFGMQASRGFMMPSLTAFFNYGSAYNFQHNQPDSVRITTTEPIVVQDPSSSSGYSIQEKRSSSTISNPQLARPFDNQFRSDNVYKQYGVQLSIPLFNGLQNRTAFTQQKILYENSQLTRKNIEYQIRNDVVRTVRNYEGAKKAYVVSLDQLKAAELAFQLETERFNLGVTNFVDFTNANRVFVQAQTDKAQAEYRFVFQRILLEYAVGTLKAEDLQPPQR